MLSLGFLAENGEECFNTRFYLLTQLQDTHCVKLKLNTIDSSIAENANQIVLMTKT